MPLRFPKRFDLTRCVHCQSDFNRFISGIGVTMDNQGALTNPNEDFHAHFMVLGCCIECKKNNSYNFSPKLHCGGTFDVYRSEPHHWVMETWVCPPPVMSSPSSTGDTGKVTQMIIDDETVALLEPARPGDMLEQWYQHQPEDRQAEFRFKTGFSESTLREIFNGGQPIDRDVALQLSLSDAFVSRAQYWYWMQLDYDEYQKTGQPIDKSTRPSLW
jgi:plasmid maintenance system antidote protein VapI